MFVSIYTFIYIPITIANIRFLAGNTRINISQNVASGVEFEH